MCKGKNGATLIEVVSTVAILFVVLAPLSLIFNTWYDDYYEENYRVMLQKRSMETMQQIMQDLRMFADGNTAVVDSGTKLFIKGDLIYSYSPYQKKLFKNSTSVFLDSETIEVTAFNVEETSVPDNDSSLINITITLKTKRNIEITLQNSYRRKLG
ncbi:MAG: hypothetical protein N3B21_00105 [Clostridia bacterium]|nr:hypothetical protein [Clostridia bacterium]